jgi:chromosome segregation ATPase
METALVERTPDVIAAEINTLKAQARNTALSYIVAIGQRLIEAKALLTYGSWGAWLEKTVDYSQRTAQNMMRIAERFGSAGGLLTEREQSQALAELDLDYSKAVALLALPAEEMEAFAAEHDVEAMSSRELQEAIRERDEAKKRAESLEDEADSLRGEAKDSKDEAKRLMTEKAAAEKDAEKLRKQLKDAQENKAAEKSIKDLTDKLATAQRQVQELSDSLEQATKPEAVEITPPEVKQELEELRETKRKLESKITMMDPAAVKFRIHFDALQQEFTSLLSDLDAIGQQDSDKAEKCRGAVRQLLGKMEERLG